MVEDELDGFRVNQDKSRVGLEGFRELNETFLVVQVGSKVLHDRFWVVQEGSSVGLEEPREVYNVFIVGAGGDGNRSGVMYDDT